MRLPAALTIVLLSAAAAAAAPGPARAAGGACPAAAPATVSVTAPPIEVAFQAVADPVRYAPFPKAMESSLGPGWTINGLTVVRPLVKTQIETADAPAAAGGDCVWPTKVSVSFGFEAPANIYVSNRYRPGTCEFETIRNHENQHVGIHVNTRLKHVALMRARIEAALAALGPVDAGDTAAGKARVQAAISDAIDDGIKAYRIEAGTLSGMIDSTQSYLQLQSRCTGW